MSDSAGHGVSGWQLFDATDADSLRETSYEYRWRTILDEVLAEGGVVLALQRVVHLADGEIHHMEVLARIRMMMINWCLPVCSGRWPRVSV